MPTKHKSFIRKWFLPIQILLLTGLLVPAEGLMVTVQLTVLLPIFLGFLLYAALIYLIDLLNNRRK